MRVDADGEIWNVIAGAVIGAGLEVLGQLMTGTKFADINWGSVAVEGVLGAVSSVGIPAKITSKVGRVALTALRDVVAPVVAEVSIQMFQTRSNKNNNHSISNINNSRRNNSMANAKKTKISNKKQTLSYSVMRGFYEK